MMKKQVLVWLSLAIGAIAVFAQTDAITPTPQINTLNISSQGGSGWATFDVIISAIGKMSVAAVLGVVVYFLAKAYQKKDDQLTEVLKAHAEERRICIDENTKSNAAVVSSIEQSAKVLSRVEILLAEKRI